MRPSALTVISILALAGCGGDDDGGDAAMPDRPAQEGAAPGRSVGPPPDAGTRAGHGADPARVEVPEQDRAPPSAVVSLKEEITCRGRSGRPVTRPRTRYVPPPQVERITARPGFRIPIRKRRSVALPLSGGCPAGATASRVEGEVWGEAINGHGLEAVTPHIRFAWAR